MYPLPDVTLTLHSVATHWARDMAQRPPVDEVFDALLREMWLGQIDVILGDAQSRSARKRLLDVLRHDGGAPELLVIDAADGAPAVTRTLSDSSVVVDIRPRVVWPRGPSEQTPGVFKVACTAMATVTARSYPALVQPLLLALTVERDEFEAYCARTGRQLPGFWFARSQKATSAATVARFRMWLIQQIADGMLRPASKEAFFCKVLADFPGLSRRQTEEVWRTTVPREWMAPGRRSTR